MSKLTEINRLIQEHRANSALKAFPSTVCMTAEYAFQLVEEQYYGCGFSVMRASVSEEDVDAIVILRDIPTLLRVMKNVNLYGVKVRVITEDVWVE